MPLEQRQIQRGAKGARAPVRFYIPNFLIIEIIEFCLASSHKSNFHADHTHHTNHAQNWSVEPLSDFRLDPPLLTYEVLHLCHLFYQTDSLPHHFTRHLKHFVFNFISQYSGATPLEVWSAVPPSPNNPK